jgi:Flp pilus assembly protein TadB
VSGAVLLAVVGVGACCAVATWQLAPPPVRAARRIRPYTTATRSALGLPVDPVATRPTHAFGVWADLVRDLARGASRLIESRSDDAIALRLHQAGRNDDSPDEYRVRQVARGALWAAGFGGLALVVLPSPVAFLALVVAGFTFGSSRVRADVDKAIEERTERMRLELATITQLLALHVRSGAGPIQAVQRLVDRGHGATVEELREVLVWVRAGMREPEAFRRAAQITPCPEAARLHQLFATGAERGSDLASGLLAVSDDVRDARREALRRAGVKRRAAMLIPTIGVLAPIMLLFVAAPLPSIVLGNR